MEITERRPRSVTVVAVSGRVADGTPEAIEFRERMVPLVASAVARGSAVVLDFSALESIDSIGERALMIAAKQARAAGIELVMASLSPLLREIFEINRFNTLIPVYPGVTEAVTALASHDAR